jgi:hypothetical protein
MCLHSALVWFAAGCAAWHGSAASADDVVPTQSATSSSDAPPPPPDLSPREDAADAGEPTESGPEASPDDALAPPPFPVPIYWFSPVPPSPPEPSYEEISEGYPPPAHSLVPQALLVGPVFFTSGLPGGPTTQGVHVRFPYYNYRSSWTYGGPVSLNHTIVW